MSKKLYHVTVPGNSRKFGIPTYADPRAVEDWRNDGIEVIEPHNIIPEWVADLGPLAIRTWCFAQDVFNFKSP